MTKTKIMGILNVTPDSFYDGGRYLNCDKAIQRALEMIDEGADILDIGGESTRPTTFYQAPDGAAEVGESEELKRVIPVIRALKQVTSVPLSIDTVKPHVAEAAIAAGATIINDISGFRDPAMISVAAETKAIICVMHMQGAPATMQHNPHYPEGVVPHLIQFFDQKMEQLVKAGIAQDRIVIDPGIGFGKTIAHNLQILHNLPIFKARGIPLLLGVSRKSFMQRILNRPASELLAATIAINTLAVTAGIDIIRVHDVREHRDMITLMTQLQKC